MKNILIVEDDPAILRGLSESIRAEHFEVTAEKDGAAGLERARRRKFDLIILDVMLPTMNGTEICRKLREEKNPTPILMLTSKGSEMDKVMGLELGADDYMTKPFSVRELIARIRALLRRHSEIRAAIAECCFGDVAVDFAKQEMVRGKKRIAMTAKEFEILRYFVEREGEVITRAKLLDDVWGYDVTPTTRTVDNFILGIRKKIEADPSRPKHLLTVHTAGYKFVR